MAYQRRNRGLDPQLVWRGKDEQDWSDSVVQAPPLFIQEKVHPKVLIDDLLRRRKAGEQVADDQLDLVADFNSLRDDDARTELYRHGAKGGMVALKVKVKTIQRIRSQLSVGEHDFSRHAFKRLVERNISGAEIRQAGSRADVIEEYPDDKYSPSCLLLGSRVTEDRFTCKFLLQTRIW